jgi:uncharacterized protein DUF4129
MMFSSRKPEIFRTLWHPAISVSVATSTVVATMLLVNRLLGLTSPRGLTIAVVLIAPLVEAAVGNLLYSERAGVGSRARELIIYLLLLYALFSVLRPGPFLTRFSPGLVQFVPLVAAGFAWLYAFGIHNRLRGREALLRAFDGKHGATLRHALIDRQHDMALTVRELKNLRGVVAAGFLFLVILAIVTATGVFSASSLPAWSAAFILLWLNGVLAALVIGALNAFADEYSVNGVGLAVPLRFQRRRLTAAVVVVLIAAVGAFLFSRRESLLPLETIAAFFRWFAALFDPERVVPFPQPERAPTDGPSQFEMLMEMLRSQQPQLPPLWVRLLMQLLRRLVVAAGATAVAIMIFGPIFSPAFRAGLKSIHPGQLIRNAWVRFLRQATVLTRWFRLRLRRAFRRHGDLPDSDAALGRADDRARGSSLGWTPSFLKRRQMGRVVAVFASVAQWGAGHGLVYRPSEGADEYLSRIAERYPEHRGESQICAGTFWEARYSRHMLPAGSMRKYVAAARRITKAG